MIRESLVELQLPGQFPLTPSKRRRRRLYVWLVALLVGVVIWAVIGLFHRFDIGLELLYVPLLILATYATLIGPLPNGMKRWKPLCVFIVATGATAFFICAGSDDPPNLWTLVWPLLVGFFVASSFVEGVIQTRGDKWIRAALERIREPAAGASPVRTCCPFLATSQSAIWAISPTPRTLRVITPNGTDRLIEWDEPVRAVELRRVGRVFDSELVIRSGHGTTGEWAYSFDIPSAYRDSAARWFEIFESWKNEDRQHTAV